MEFTLYYRGELKSNRGPVEKQALRRVFHKQLHGLWNQMPLKERHDLITESLGEENIIFPINDFKFAPLVTERMNLIAELNIALLRPEEPGSIITQSGDVDNRLKTLFDALRMPSGPAEIPAGDKPSDGENPFFCLLEDDNLITKVSVSTDRLLDKVSSSSEVVLLIHGQTKRTRSDWLNDGLG
jgi:hypothetical protein